MPGLDLIAASRSGNFLIVRAKGIVYPPDIAKFYQSLPGWEPEPGAVSTWNQDGMLPSFKIRKGNLIVDVAIHGEQMLKPYKQGDIQEVDLSCWLH